MFENALGELPETRTKYIYEVYELLAGDLIIDVSPTLQQNWTPTPGATRAIFGAPAQTKRHPPAISPTRQILRGLSLLLNVVRPSRPPRRFSNVSVSQIEGHEALSLSFVFEPLALSLVLSMFFRDMTLHTSLSREADTSLSALCVDYWLGLCVRADLTRRARGGVRARSRKSLSP